MEHLWGGGWGPSILAQPAFLLSSRRAIPIHILISTDEHLVMKQQAVHLQGVSSYWMERTCSLLKEELFAFFFLHLIKIPGPGAGKAVGR